MRSGGRQHSDRAAYRQVAEIQRRANAMGAHRDSVIAAYLNALEENPLDESLAQLTSVMLADYEEEQRLAPNWLSPPPTFEDLFGPSNQPDFEIGTTTETGVRYGPRMSGDSGSLVITGISGGGKTSLVQNIVVGTHRSLRAVATVVFDVKGDYTCLAALQHAGIHAHKLRSELPLRLVPPPVGVLAQAWLPRFATYFCEYRGLKKSRHIFLDTLRLLCAHYGVLQDPSKPWPSLHNALDFLKQLRGSKFGKEAEYRASLINELQGLLEDSGTVFDTADGVDVEQNLLVPGGVTVLQMETLPVPAQQLIISSTIERIVSRRTAAQVHNPGLRVLVVLDEAQQVLSRKADVEASNGIAPLAAQLLRARETGVGFIVVSHLLPDISRAVLASAKTMLVVGSLSDADSIDIAARMMNLPQKAKTMIPRLGRGQALVREVGLGPYTDAFLVDLDSPVIAKDAISESTRQKMMAPKLTGLPRTPSKPLTDYPALMAQLNTPWTTPAPTAAASSATTPALAPELRDLLYDCARHRDDWMKERRARLNIGDYKVMQGYARSLEAQGLLRQHTTRLGRVTYVLLEVTDPGWQILGLPKPPHYIGHGSLEHTVFMSRIARCLSTKSWGNVQTEFPVGTARHPVDIFGRSPQGRPTAFEITLSTSNVVANAIRTLTPPSAVQELIFLCRVQKDCRAVEKLLRKDPAAAALMGQLQLRRIDEFMS